MLESFLPGKNDGIESGNKILEPEDSPTFHSAITQYNTNDNNLSSSIGLTFDVLKNA